MNKEGFVVLDFIFPLKAKLLGRKDHTDDLCCHSVKELDLTPKERV